MSKPGDVVVIRVSEVGDREDEHFHSTARSQPSRIRPDFATTAFTGLLSPYVEYAQPRPDARFHKQQLSGDQRLERLLLVQRDNAKTTGRALAMPCAKRRDRRR